MQWMSVKLDYRKDFLRMMLALMMELRQENLLRPHNFCESQQPEVFFCKDSVKLYTYERSLLFKCNILDLAERFEMEERTKVEYLYDGFYFQSFDLDPNKTLIVSNQMLPSSLKELEPKLNPPISRRTHALQLTNKQLSEQLFKQRTS